MANVVDSLVVELGLDPAKFTKGQKAALEAYKKTQEQAISGAKAIEESGRKLNDVFSLIKRGSLEMVGVLLGGKGLKDAFSHIVNLDAGLGRVSKTLNMGVRDVSKWVGASEQIGGSGEGIVAALQGLSGAMNTFMLTGQGPFLGVMTQLKLSLFNPNTGKLKTAGEMLLDIADAVHKVNQSDPARAAALLAMIPGANQDSINLMINGKTALLDLLAAADKAGSTTEEAAAQAAKYQQQLSLLQRTAIDLGRSLMNLTFDPITKGLKKDIGVLDLLKKEPGRVIARFIDPVLEEWLYGKEGAGEKGALEPVTNFSVSHGNKKELEAYIRQAAIKRGIDPNVAVAVAKSEGFKDYVGDKGTSFGPFQLHYKNNIPGLSNSGLGDKFTKQTGMHASDPSTVKQQIDFALDEAKKSGWGAWHGWKGLPYQGISPGGGASSSPAARSRSSDASGSGGGTTISIDKVEVVTQATEAEGIARDIKPALERQSFAAQANYGQR